jgi:hypothetical protein
MRKSLTTTGIALLAFLTGTTASFFTLPIWVTVVINAAKEGSRTDWLGFAGGIIGSLLSAGVAVAAIAFAWRGVSQQVKISVVSREEDRIERELPDLQDLSNAVDALTLQLSLNHHLGLQTPETFEAIGFVPANNTPIVALRTRFPRVDDRELRELAEIVSSLQSGPDMGRATVMMLGANGEPVTTTYEFYAMAVNRLATYRERLTARIRKSEAMLPILRSEMERFLAR